MMERDEDTFAASGKTVYRDCINWSNNDHCAKTKANYCHPDCGDYRQLVKLVKRPETLEEIEADLRSDNRRFSNSTGMVIAQRIEAARKRMEWTHKKELETRDAVIQTEVAAREAEREAHKREMDELRKQVGNATKLRDALSAALDMIFGLQVCNRSPIANSVYAVRRKIKDALNTPARNCDRFANAVEAMAELKRIHSYCAKENRRCLEDCPDCGKEWCSLAWLFAPATESEAQA